MFLFDQLVYRSRPKPVADETAPPSPAHTTGRLNAVLAKGATVFGGGGGGGYSVTNALSTRSMRGSRGAAVAAANKRPGLPAAFLEAGKSRSLSPTKRPSGSSGSESGSASVSSGSRHAAGGDLTPRAGGGGGGGGGDGGKVPVMDRVSRKVAVGLGKIRSGPGSSSAGANISGSSGRSSGSIGGGGGGSYRSSAAATEANSSTGTLGTLIPSFHGDSSGHGDGDGDEDGDDNPVGFRRLGGGGWAGGLSVIEDDESQAGSALASVRARGSEDYFGGEESKAERPLTGSYGWPTSDSGEAAAGATASRDQDDDSDFDKRLARVTAGSGRSFSTAEGDDNDDEGGGDAGNAASATGRPSEGNTDGRSEARGGKGGQGREGKKDTNKKEGVEGDEEDAEEEEEEEDDEVLLTRDTLCPGLDNLLLDVAFKIFDGNGNDFITKEVCVSVTRPLHFHERRMEPSHPVPGFWL